MAIGLCSALKINQWLSSGAEQPMTGKPARMGGASGYIMQAFAKAPQVTWMNEWMNEWCIYIALYCVLLYTQSTLQSCGGSLLNHHQCAASTCAGLLYGMPRSILWWFFQGARAATQAWFTLTRRHLWRQACWGTRGFSQYWRGPISVVTVPKFLYSVPIPVKIHGSLYQFRYQSKTQKHAN